MVLQSLNPQEIIHDILAYVITYFGQARNYVGQVRIIKLLAWHGKLVLKLMLVPAVKTFPTKQNRQDILQVILNI